MVEYITGINGVGKTRIMCEACINTAAESKGNVIFIVASDKLSTRLPSNIRLINVSDFGIEGATALCGFLVGLCASDYDLTDIFVDSTIDIINNNNTNLDDFFDILTKFSDKTGVNFHFAVCDKYSLELAYQSN